MVSVTFLSLVGAIGRPTTFGLYAVLGLAALLYFRLRVPETRGKSLEQLQAELGRQPAEGEPHPAPAPPAAGGVA